MLFYTNEDPLSSQLPAPSHEDIYEKLIRIVPKVGAKDNDKSIIAIYVSNGLKAQENAEFKRITITIDIYTPLTQWIIKNANLRPFAIIGKIQECLDGKTVNGLGKLSCGDFNLILLTEDVSCYQMKIAVIEYD